MNADEFDLEHAQMQEIDDCKGVKKYQKEDDESSTIQLKDLDSKTEFGKTNELTENINIQMNIQIVNKKESSSKSKLAQKKENLDRASENLSKTELIAEMNPIQIDGVSNSERSQQQKETNKADDLQNLIKDLKDFKATRDLYGGVLQKLEEADFESSAPSKIPIEGNETWQDFDSENYSINLFDDVEIGEIGHLEALKPGVEAPEPRVDEELEQEDLVEDPRGPGYEYWESASTESISELLDDSIQKDRRKTIFWTVFLFFSCLVIISCVTIPTLITKQNARRKQSQIEASETQSVKAEQSQEKVAKRQPNKSQEPNLGEVVDAEISENPLPENEQQHHNTHSDCSQKNDKMVVVPQNRKFMTKFVKQIVLAAVLIAVVLALYAFDLGSSMRTAGRVEIFKESVGDQIGTAGDKVAAIKSSLNPKTFIEKIRKTQVCDPIGNEDAETCMIRLGKKQLDDLEFVKCINKRQK